MSGSYDIAIVGAGCAGLSVAKFASESGKKCIIIDRQLPGAFSSVRNQGWLHSGALYVVSGTPGATEMVPEFTAAGELMRDFDRKVGGGIVSPTQSLMLFNSTAGLDAAVARLAAADIWRRVVCRDEMLALEPNLGRGSRFIGGVLTSDASVNTPRLLRALIDAATASGCDLYAPSVAALEQLEFTRIDDSWLIDDNGEQIQARSIVLCCGPLLPRIAQQCFGIELGAVVKKCLIIAVQRRVSSRLITMQSQATGLLNIAPFKGGTTFNRGLDDEIVKDVDDAPSDDGKTISILGSLREYFPGVLGEGAISFSEYSTFKLDFPNSGDFGRAPFVRELDWHLLVFYPGKLTLAMLEGERIASRLEAASSAKTGRIATRKADDVLHPALDARNQRATVWAGETGDLVRRHADGRIPERQL